MNTSASLPLKLAATLILAGCGSPIEARSTSGNELWECQGGLPLHNNSLIHPIVRSDFGPYRRGQVAILSSGWEFNIWYCPERGAQPIRVRNVTDTLGLYYEVRSVFSYGPIGRPQNKLVILYRAGRAVPGMQDTSAFGGEVYEFNSGRAYRIERDSIVLSGIATAAEARAALRRNH